MGLNTDRSDGCNSDRLTVTDGIAAMNVQNILRYRSVTDNSNKSYYSNRSDHDSNKDRSAR